ncbi:MAG: recombinase family protein [Pseudomonadota bacterium]
MKAIAIGYMRVSTEGQYRDGISPDMQISKIKAYCELNDVDLVGIYGDPAISGKNIKARPGIQAVLDMVDKKKIEHVVCYKLDRLARNTIETLEMVSAMDKRGIALHSVTEKLDTHSAIGRFVVRTLASLAEMERDLISERTANALQTKRERNEKTGGIVPFGFTLADDGKTLLPHASEQQIIEKIHRLKAKGHSFRSIADELNRDGHRTKTGKAWTHRQVARLFNQAA